MCIGWQGTAAGRAHREGATLAEAGAGSGRGGARVVASEARGTQPKWACRYATVETRNAYPECRNERLAHMQKMRFLVD